MQTGSSSKYILAYDANCGPCTRFRRIVEILDKYERIDFISLTKADQEGLLDKIPVHQRYKSFHLIFPKGHAKSGSQALLELIAILPGGKIISPIINYFPGGKKAVRFIYKRYFKSFVTHLQMFSGLEISAKIRKGS
jgi:predicted DCC family thiol-disulfide oxidoreductase YuxK